ncbi:MAG: glycosyltransferase family protein [Candidatus Zixiibacteriota bacterium]
MSRINDSMIREDLVTYSESEDSSANGSGQKRILIYSHDTFGLGHLQRCLKICRALVDRDSDISILLVTGSPWAHRYRFPERVDYLKMPAVRKVGTNQYVPRSLKTSFDRVYALRKDLLLQSVQTFDPHLLLVDHAPVGMRGELLPALQWHRQHRPQAVRVLGLRDIVDEPAYVIDHWKRNGIYEIMDRMYERIAIYGSRAIFDLVAAYQIPPELHSRIEYCNYVSNYEVDTSEEVESKNERPLIVVSIGGGDGAAEEVIGNYLDMVEQYASTLQADSIVVTGPFISSDLLRQYHSRCDNLPVEVRRFVSNLSSYMRRSDLIVSTGGYNTVTESIGYGRRALLIPRVVYREEQLMRARRFAELGLVKFIHPKDVTARLLFDMVSEMLDDQSCPLTEARRIGRIPLDGAHRIAALCCDAMAEQLVRQTR